MRAEVIQICEAVSLLGGRALLVGGWVRDRLLEIDSKDYDIEVYGVDPLTLRSTLEGITKVNTVGASFAVYKLAFNQAITKTSEEGDSLCSDQPNRNGSLSREERFEIDVSIPRRESRSGRGHRGFAVEGDPSMSFEEAARRRDFTINAILFDPLTEEIIDPYGGAADLDRRILKAVDAETFVEDSLRVLRAVQLASRFQLTIDPATVELCRTIDLSDLPHERIWGEIEKLLTMSAQPSIGLECALDLGVLDKLFPEIKALVGCPQEPEWHPEGDVFIHTKLCMDQATKVVTDLPREKRIVVMLAVLCHDLGKPLTTSVIDGRIRSLRHDAFGIEPAISVLDKLGIYTIAGYPVRDHILALVREHLRPGQFYDERERLTDGAFRRLARKVDLDLLYRVAKADSMGRESGSSSFKQEWFIERARSLGVEHGAPAAILLGRHLIEAGFVEGPKMGEVLRRVYELQLDGEVTTLEEALAAARRLGQ
jgi:tRNA nucleotidyltransferase (CCA-adding enzyme)